MFAINLFTAVNTRHVNLLICGTIWIIFLIIFIIIDIVIYRMSVVLMSFTSINTPT